MYPHYSYPPKLITAILRDMFAARPRHFQDDARACIQRLGPPLQVLGGEYIPQAGPYVITVNHYYRAGFGAQWFALAISAAIPLDVHWIMTGKLTYPGKWYAPFGKLLWRLILQRGAHLYGFTTMPPMPPRPRDVSARALSVRAVLNYVKRARCPVVGLAPEGGDQPNGQLTMPAPGLGRFVLLLAAQGLRFAPVGAYESNGIFCLNFGQPYELKVCCDKSAREKDRLAAQMLMSHIAPLLPSSLRGEFA